MTYRSLTFGLALCFIGLTGCYRTGESGAKATLAQKETSSPQSKVPASVMDPCALVLVPHVNGSERVDVEIRRVQLALNKAQDKGALIERLGWMYVAKARASFDPGYYKLAEACAHCLETSRPECPEGLLLRGHVLHNLHRFQEAEPIARKLATKRGLAFDYGLLGDVLLEEGRLPEALSAYQQMVDLKPDLHSYARAGQMRWLKGDVSGALEAMQMAAQATSPHDPESAAWIYSRWALYELQAGTTEKARQICEGALNYQKDYPPALLILGRIHLAINKVPEAISYLRKAEKLNPLPEYQWLLADALRLGGHAEEAQVVEARLKKSGAANDPRTFALYLATRGEAVATALALTENELQQRGDVFTHDALAWSQAAAGRWAEASQSSRRALAEGTQDARLFYHAGQIALKLGQSVEARRWFEQAASIQQMLFPSERQELPRASGKMPHAFAEAAPVQP